MQHRDGKQIFTPRSPTPPPGVRRPSDHDTSGSHPQFSPDVKPVVKHEPVNVKQEPVNVKPELENVKHEPVGYDHDGSDMGRISKRRSVEHADLDMDIQDNKKGKLDRSVSDCVNLGNYGSDEIIDLDDCDVMDIQPRAKPQLNLVKPEPHSIQGNDIIFIYSARKHR